MRGGDNFWLLFQGRVTDPVGGRLCCQSWCSGMGDSGSFFMSKCDLEQYVVTLDLVGEVVSPVGLVFLEDVDGGL